MTPRHTTSPAKKATARRMKFSLEGPNATGGPGEQGYPIRSYCRQAAPLPRLFHASYQAQGRASFRPGTASPTITAELTWDPWAASAPVARSKTSPQVNPSSAPTKTCEAAQADICLRTASPPRVMSGPARPLMTRLAVPPPAGHTSMAASLAIQATVVQSATVVG